MSEYILIVHGGYPTTHRFSKKDDDIALRYARNIMKKEHDTPPPKYGQSVLLKVEKELKMAE